MLSAFTVLILASVVSAVEHTNSSTKAAINFAGYLISTFSDANPTVQLHLSHGNDAGSFTFANRGRPIMTSTVGTRAVRDVFLACNGDRTQWYMIGTDLNINAPGFSWDKATRRGSRGIVVWKSSNLVDWSASRLETIEDATAGMVWAPSAVWDVTTSQFHVFYAARSYPKSDAGHTGPATPDRIRTVSTKDFITFTPPKDYATSPAGLIDQEFQYLGIPNHWARFIKNEKENKVYQELSTTGIFGQWTRVPGWVVNEAPREGPASFADNVTPGLYHLLLDDYKHYVPFQTSDVEKAGGWQRSRYPNFPGALKHGSVTPLTKEEYDRFAAKYVA